MRCHARYTKPVPSRVDVNLQRRRFRAVHRPPRRLSGALANIVASLAGKPREDMDAYDRAAFSTRACRVFGVIGCPARLPARLQDTHGPTLARGRPRSGSAPDMRKLGACALAPTHCASGTFFLSSLARRARSFFLLAVTFSTAFRAAGKAHYQDMRDVQDLFSLGSRAYVFRACFLGESRVCSFHETRAG